jgi:hypothetical protein
MPIDAAGQRVNQAVAMAVRRLVDGASDAHNRDGLGRSIGKRIQGAYGAELRRMVDLYPDRTAEELYALVIVPHEFPWDTEQAAEAALARIGARDKARARRDGPVFDPDDPDLTPPEEVAGRVAKLRQRMRGPAL